VNREDADTGPNASCRFDGGSAPCPATDCEDAGRCMSPPRQDPNVPTLPYGWPGTLRAHTDGRY
jgi:hypothetical protein